MAWERRMVISPPRFDGGSASLDSIAVSEPADGEGQPPIRHGPILGSSSRHKDGSSGWGHRMRRGVGVLGREWRVLLVALLLVTLCVLVRHSPVDVRVKVDTAQKKGHDTYASLKKRLSPHETFLTPYTQPDDSEALLLEFPLSYLRDVDKQPPVIFAATFARGQYDDTHNDALLHSPAESTDHTVFQFNLTSDMTGIDVLRLHFGLRTTDQEQLASLRLGAPPTRVTTLPIVIHNPPAHGRSNGSVVVDASDLLQNGFYITDFGKPRVPPRVRTCRSFPLNFDVTIDYLFKPPSVHKEDSQEADEDSKEEDHLEEKVVMFSVAQLPADPITARAADERVGYFSVTYTDVGDHRADKNYTAAYSHQADLFDTEMAVINRRRLSRDSAITFYIDPTVPERWRPAFRAGVELWTPAFKAAGFGESAIRAVLPGEPDWPKDYDAGDIRFSTISWVPDVDKTFSLSPSVIDPRSGEILGSHIFFTHGWIKEWAKMLTLYDKKSLSELLGPGGGGVTEPEQLDEVGRPRNHTALTAPPPPPTAVGPKGGGGARLRRHLSAPHRGKSPAASRPAHSHAHAHEHARSRGSSYRFHRRGSCQHARHADDDSALVAGLALAAAGVDVKLDDVLFAGMRETIAHEVGHALGLRHNFKGSAAVTWDQSQDPAFTKAHGLSASVMDYLPLNILSTRDGLGAGVIDYFSPTIGDYDVMAVRYGYTPVFGEVDGVPHPALTAIADANLPFSTDEDGEDEDGHDPYASKFDLTSEPHKYFNDRLKMVAKLRPLVVNGTLTAGDDFTRVSRAHEGLTKTALRAAGFLTKFIGGFTVSRARAAADPQPPPVAPVAADVQAEALKGVLRVLADDEELLFPSGTTAGYMPAPAGDCAGLYRDCLGRQPPTVLKDVEEGRARVLAHLVDHARLERVRTAEWMLKAQGVEGALSVPALLAQVTEALWGTKIAASERVGNARHWGIQLAWLNALVKLATRHGGGAAGAGAKGGEEGEKDDEEEKVSWEIVAAATGEVGRIQESVEAVLGAGTPADPAYPLLRAALVRLQRARFVKST